MKAFKFIMAAGVAAVVGTSSQARANLLTDPGAENETAAPNPNPTGIPGWALFNGGAFLTTGAAHGGNNVIDTPAFGGGYSVPGAYQDFAATPGQMFTFSGYVYTPNTLVPNSNDFGILQLSFYTGAPPSNYAGGSAVGPAVGVNIGTPIGGGAVALPQGIWTFASVTGTAPAGTNSLGAYLLDINADANATFYWDDLSLTLPASVPEPTSLCLLGLGGLALISRRKAVRA